MKFPSIRGAVARLLHGAAARMDKELEGHVAAMVTGDVEARIADQVAARVEARMEELSNPILQSFLEGNLAGRSVDGGYEPLDQNFRAYMDATGHFPILTACDDAIGNAASLPPLQLVRTGRDGKEELVEKHALLDRLRDPNPEQGWAQFIYAQAQQWGRTGNIYVSGVGIPEIVPWPNLEELWVLPSGRTKPVPNRDLQRRGRAENPISHYIYSGDGTTPVRFAPTQILHTKRPHPTDPIVGLSPVKELETTLNLLHNTMQYLSGYYKAGGAPGNVFIRKGARQSPNPDQSRRFEKTTDTTSSDVRKGKRNLYLWGDWSVSELGNDPQKAAALDVIELMTQYILAVRGVPPFEIASVEHANWSNSVEQQSFFWQRAVMPFLRAVTDAMNTHPIVTVWQSEGERLSLRHDYSKIEALSPNKLAQAQRASMLVRNQVAKQNEGRAEVGLEPVPDGDRFVEFGAKADAAADAESDVAKNALNTQKVVENGKNRVGSLAALEV